VDPSKDQSYFLFALTQEQLARAVFPVGDRPKDAVREYAHERQLPVASKPDSQEICFIPDNDYASFVAARSPVADPQGVIVNEQGDVVGRHEGVHRFTVGQRKGLGLSNAAGSAGSAPVYVLALNAAERQVMVGPKTSLERTTLTASGVNWIIPPPATGLRASVQIRHRHRAAPAAVQAIEGESVLSVGSGSAATGRAAVIFDAPQVAVTPGQAVVFYQDDVVIGGGWID